MKGNFKPKKKETPIPRGELEQRRHNDAVICGTLAGACGQIQDAARIAAEVAQRARTILDTPELRAYLTDTGALALEVTARRCESAAATLRADYAPLYALEQRVRALGAVERIPSSGHSPSPAKKKSLSEIVAPPSRSLGRKNK